MMRSLTDQAHVDEEMSYLHVLEWVEVLCSHVIRLGLRQDTAKQRDADVSTPTLNHPMAAAGLPDSTSSSVWH